MTTDKTAEALERQAFEAQMRERNPKVVLEKGPDGDYGHDCCLQSMWEGWQAARKQQWLPIETAPKDGTSILGYWLGGQHDFAIHATKFERGRWWEPNQIYPMKAPTHWMPLQPPPTQPQE